MQPFESADVCRPHATADLSEARIARNGVRFTYTRLNRPLRDAVPQRPSVSMVGGRNGVRFTYTRLNRPLLEKGTQQQSVSMVVALL